MEVQHRKGTDHDNADFLSRLEQMTDGTYQMEMVVTQAPDGRVRKAPDGTDEVFWIGNPIATLDRQVRIQLQMNEILQSKPKTLTTLPQIPLRNNVTLEEHFLAKIEHRQVNQAFINRLKQEQATDQWIQDLKQAITFPDMRITPTQKWASANLLMEIDGILIRCAERATEGTPP